MGCVGSSRSALLRIRGDLLAGVRDAVHAAVVGAMDQPGHPQASRGPVRYDIGKAMLKSVDYAIGDFPPYDPADTAKNREFRERRRAGGSAVNMNKPVSDEVLWQLEWFLDSVVRGAVDLVVGGPVTDAVRDAVQTTAKRCVPALRNWSGSGLGGWVGVYRGFRGQLLRAHGLGCGPRTIGDGC